MSQSPDQVSRALTVVLGRFAERVRHVGQRHGLTGTDVEDLVQEVRLRLWRALDCDERILQAPASYVHRAAVSAALDVLRRRRARRETPMRPTPPSGRTAVGAAPAADAQMEREEFEMVVGRAVDQLLPARRSVVRMYLAGYDRAEIAGLFGWTDARTRNLLYRGLADLRERLAAAGIGPEAQ